MAFWFNELQPEQWWQVNTDLDHHIADRFCSTHTAAAAAELANWRREPDGSLAEIIVLDQFSRNIFRNQPLAFAFDGMALVLAQEAIEKGHDQALPISQRAFMYLPFMHSESQVIHQTAVTLFSQQGLEQNLEFEHKHKRIVDRFGRYPHRNDILGRASTAEELAFLKEPDSSF